MARKILSVVFWSVALCLVVWSASSGGAFLAVPLAVVATAAAFGVDLALHRRLVKVDRDLLVTALHLLSAAAVASACMVWLAGVLRHGLG